MGDSPGDATNSSVIRVYDEAGNVIETHNLKHTNPAVVPSGQTRQKQALELPP
jgi:hypothetical protein